MDNSHFADSVGLGFVSLLDVEPGNGSHFIRAAHITAIRPVWNDDEDWIGCDVFTLDGTKRRVNASLEQIMAAMECAEKRMGSTND